MMYIGETRALPAWRNVISPQSDVREGKYKTAEFAADLASIFKRDETIEYLDPAEFFRRTYITGGMKGLLSQALMRASGKDGEPVIQLKTAFGGGKTHSMFALYHFMRGNNLPALIPELNGVLDSAGVSEIPKTNVAVFVGTSEDVSSSHTSNGITYQTAWGAIAAQLAKNAGNPSLYEYVRSADEKSVAPGSRALAEMFDACGPCLVLMDEVVAYARKLEGARNLPAGTFDNFLSFMQEITEAAKLSKNSMVVATIPESNIEAGGETGQKALDAVEHTFGRVEAIWKPVAADEGFEIVRRRLFCEINHGHENIPSLVANSFSKMYADNKNDFPAESWGIDYRDRIVSCYPIHPEIFDRLYGDWATLDKFQRTRGVLRLMAAVIHELWVSNDGSPLIMPGTIPISADSVGGELKRYLPEKDTWNTVIDKEIDGKSSIPYRKDKEIQRFGDKLAARRVARAIMLGSAPSSRAQAVRGIDKSRIRLGVVCPGEGIADFNDALGTLQSELAYLYTDSSGCRFWYDTKPTLRKTVDERKARIPDSDVKREIISRLKKIGGVKPFAGVHICPGASGDVPDVDSVRLVVLAPDCVYSSLRGDESPAVVSCSEILQSRGNAARINRNMLVFLAPDQGQMEALKSCVSEYLAWKSIDGEKEALNLDASQNREVRDNITRLDSAMNTQIYEAWRWLVAPEIKLPDISKILWKAERVTGSGLFEDRISRSASENEIVIAKWAPMHLESELDRVLWKGKDDISLKDLWEYLCRHCYLPRLSGYDVLEGAVKSGVEGGYFALAESKSDGGEYDGVKINCRVEYVNKSACLVRKGIALKQIEPPESPANDSPVNDSSKNDSPKESVKPSAPKPPASFHLSVPLEAGRPIKFIDKLNDEVISHIANFEGSKVSILLEVHATIPEGFPPDLVSIISDNCNTLKLNPDFY